MIQQIEIRRLRASTLLRIYFIGSLLTFYPFFIIAGVAAAFGAETLKAGNVQVHGWMAIADALLLPPIFALGFSVFWLVGTWPGLWIYSKFKSMHLSFYTPEPNHALQRTGIGGEAFSDLHA